MISCFALLRSIPSVVKSFKLSATSVSPTFGWKKIGASNNDKTESTPSNFDNDSSIWESWFKDWYEKSSNSGLKVTIKKLESPNSFSFSLYVFNDSSPSKTNASEDASNLKFEIPCDAIKITNKTADNIFKGFLITKIEYFDIKFFISFFMSALRWI